MTDQLSERLRTTSNMINMGEPIAWGSDAGLMEDAADHIESQAATIKALVDVICRCPPNRPQMTDKQFIKTVDVWWRLEARPALVEAKETK